MIKEDADNKGDFMNKKWFLPTVDFLKECNRVLKDGAFFVTTFSPRADLQCVFSYRLLEAGFDINFTPLLYAFASGFPKAADFSKMADRRAKAEREVVGKDMRWKNKKMEMVVNMQCYVCRNGNGKILQRHNQTNNPRSTIP
jgi:hypothetical protein